MSMRKFYSLVAMVQQDDIREQLFAWAADNIFEVSIETATVFSMPSEYVEHQGKAAMMELGATLFKEAKYCETKFWTHPNQTRITNRTVRLLRNTND